MIPTPKLQFRLSCLSGQSVQHVHKIVACYTFLMTQMSQLLLPRTFHLNTH